MKRIGGGDVHTLGQLGSEVKVAIIDSGIDHTHPELAGNFAGGKDFVNNDNDSMDDNGHCTHVAGTVAAVKDASGVDFDCRSDTFMGMKDNRIKS